MHEQLQGSHARTVIQSWGRQLETLYFSQILIACTLLLFPLFCYACNPGRRKIVILNLCFKQKKITRSERTSKVVEQGNESILKMCIHAKFNTFCSGTICQGTHPTNFNFSSAYMQWQKKSVKLGKMICNSNSSSSFYVLLIHQCHLPLLKRGFFITYHLMSNGMIFKHFINHDGYSLLQ